VQSNKGRFLYHSHASEILPFVCDRWIYSFRAQIFSKVQNPSLEKYLR
jgi:hypothetical protein